ncbi:hypothetical protein Bca52824_038145 [Brassica carinata]|uniref:Uncharacterized protein n=1 Tax=Brassica carinata TaxID=52824 RepID=A0A8X7RNF2_BRACI|nr:hypothetical protein Bca52824_038145 [Brassica carinata]
MRLMSGRVLYLGPGRILLNLKMLSFSRTRSPGRNTSPLAGGMDYLEPKRKSNVMGRLVLIVSLTALCITMLKNAPSFTSPTSVSNFHNPIC